MIIVEGRRPETPRRERRNQHTGPLSVKYNYFNGVSDYSGTFKHNPLFIRKPMKLSEMATQYVNLGRIGENETWVNDVELLHIDHVKKEIHFTPSIEGLNLNKLPAHRSFAKMEKYIEQYGDYSVYMGYKYPYSKPVSGPDYKAYMLGRFNFKIGKVLNKGCFLSYPELLVEDLL